MLEKGRNLDKRKVIIAIAIVGIILLAGVLVNGKRQAEDVPLVTNIEDLEGFSVYSLMETLYLEEGSAAQFDVLGDYPPPLEGRSVFFIEAFGAYMLWNDEDDVTPYRVSFENQPDIMSIELSINGGEYVSTAESDTSMGSGDCYVSWSGEMTWLAIGDRDLVDVGDANVTLWDSLESIEVTVEMVAAGDHQHPYLPGQTVADPGNAYVIQIGFVGYVYEP